MYGAPLGRLTTVSRDGAGSSSTKTVVSRSRSFSPGHAHLPLFDPCRPLPDCRSRLGWSGVIFCCFRTDGLGAVEEGARLDPLMSLQGTAA